MMATVLNLVLKFMTLMCRIVGIDTMPEPYVSVERFPNWGPCIAWSVVIWSGDDGDLIWDQNDTYAHVQYIAECGRFGVSDIIASGGKITAWSIKN